MLLLQLYSNNKLGVSLTDDLGKYMDVPLLHSRVKSATHLHFLDKVKECLSAWKESTLSRGKAYSYQYRLLLYPTLYHANGFTPQLCL